MLKDKPLRRRRPWAPSWEHVDFFLIPSPVWWKHSCYSLASFSTLFPNPLESPLLTLRLEDQAGFPDGAGLANVVRLLCAETGHISNNNFVFL
jgi:hypothetical protein